MNEFVSILTGICFGLFFILFLLSYILYNYLDLRNTPNSLPFAKIDFAIFTSYEKNVQIKDEKVKNFRNKVLKISGYLFLIGFVLFSILMIFK